MDRRSPNGQRGRGGGHAPTARPQAGGRKALVLAGGGITGAVYEIGALRAIDDMLIDHSVNDFDIYVGTSAGALIAAMLANGLTPEEMMQGITDSHPEFRGIQAQDLFQSNLWELLGRLPRLPRTALRSLRKHLLRGREMAWTAFLWEFAELLPTGLYSSQALERYVADLLARRGCIDRFDHLEKDLFVVATDLDTGERAVFGKGGHGIVPISKAVAASSALPGLYKPVRIDDKDYVDGGIRGNASIDLAVEAGASLVVCINPLTPLDARAIYGPQGHLVDQGLPVVLRQVLRVMLHAGLRYHIKTVRRQYPEVDIILIEPRPDDQRMFQYDLMDYANRLRVMHYGFESVAEHLADQYAYVSHILGRHQIAFSPALVNEEVDEIRRSGYDARVMERVLQPGSDSLDGALNRLEHSLLALHHILGSDQGPPQP